MITRLYYSGWDNRNAEIVKACAQKKVLDIGIVDHSAMRERYADWLHGNIKNVAREVLGIDVDKKSIDALGAKGYRVLCADAEDFILNDTFEVIVAGELIEHLNNPGRFLQSVKRHMRAGSLFVLTTPNCVRLFNFAQMIRYGRLPCNNEEHTHWHDFHTIKRLLENHGFEVLEISYVIPHASVAGMNLLRIAMKESTYLLHAAICHLNKHFAPILLVKSVLR